jgi:hypothetical protein
MSIAPVESPLQPTFTTEEVKVKVEILTTVVEAEAEQLFAGSVTVTE